MIRNMYAGLPDTAKNLIDCAWGNIPLSVKYGREYLRYKSLLSKSQYWEPERLKRYQLEQLKKLCVHAYRHVPYYHDLFVKHHFDPGQMRDLRDIEALPFLDKDIISTHFDRLVADNIPARAIATGTTGGTSGKQLRFAMRRGSYGRQEYPFVDAIWSRVGYVRNKSRLGVLRNQVLPKGVLCQYDYRNKSYIFDTYHLNDENISYILDKIRQLDIEYIHAYPSTVLILCEYIKRKKIRYTSGLKAVLATSENLYPGQRELMEGMLGCRVFPFYGHSERAVIAGWCEASDLYHIQPEYGYCELVGADGKTITESEKRGEIVCTGFCNNVMPFIRYKTGDYSSYAREQSCSCGRHYKLLNNIEGRWTQEMFVGKDHNKISMTALNMHSEVFDHVENYQFIQNEVGRCILRITKKGGYLHEDESAILEALDKKFDGALRITIEYVDQIERTQMGKQRFIVQNLDG